MITNTLSLLIGKVQRAMGSAFGEEYENIDPLIVTASNPKFGDYQANIAMSLGKKLGQPPRNIANLILDRLDVNDLCDVPTIAGPGFINFKLKKSYLESQLLKMHGDDRLGIPIVTDPLPIVVDFSSPNIAKEMHVGHLRSTIIGDCLSRVLEFIGYPVIRLNHIGDWGTQFGMLICYLKEVYPSALTTADALDIGDLVEFYKQAKARFDADEEFQKSARGEVVKLQAGDQETLRAWRLLCDQSRREFQLIYDDLDIKLTERGESFYNDYLPAVVEDLNAAKILVENQGAQCVFVDGFLNKEGEPLPLIVKKSDGGYNYATTDLAAIRYRIKEDQAQRIIYVTDAGQANHFAQVFAVAKKANWVPDGVELVHVPFGLVLGEDGKKFRTRAGDTVKLKDLLQEAIASAKQDLKERLEEENRQETPEFIEQVSKAVGLGAVKYADLSQNRQSNYVFSYAKMLARQGNTAPYMLYAYVRVQGISRKGEIDWENLGTVNLALGEETEFNLAKHLLQLGTTIGEVERDLLPNRLCQYLFELSQKFNQFYDSCDILQAQETEKISRLVLCDLTARTLKLGLDLLGIKVVDRM